MDSNTRKQLLHFKSTQILGCILVSCILLHMCTNGNLSIFSGNWHHQRIFWLWL